MKYLKYLPYLIILVLFIILAWQYSRINEYSSEYVKRHDLNQEIAIREEKIEKLEEAGKQLLADIWEKDKEIADLRSKPPTIETKYEKIRADYMDLPELIKDSLFSDRLSQETAAWE